MEGGVKAFQSADAFGSTTLQKQHLLNSYLKVTAYCSNNS